MSDLKKQLIGVFIYLLTVRCMDLFTKGVVSPILEKMGLDEAKRECIKLMIEITTIVVGLYILKRTVINKRK